MRNIIIGTTWDYINTPWTGNMIRSIIADYNNIWRAIDSSRQYIGNDISIEGLHKECSKFKSAKKHCVQDLLSLESPNVNMVRNLAKQYEDGIDGYIAPGGGNIEPWIYGNTMTKDELASYQDELLFRTLLELFIIHFCYRRGKPLLGICRGHQLFAVYFGGKLVDVEGQHLVTQRDYLVRQNTIVKGIAKDQSFKARNFHHQTVDTKELPLWLEVAALAEIEDGVVIKCFEGVSQSFVLTAQFHPEYHWRYKQLKASSISPFAKSFFRTYFMAVRSYAAKQKTQRELLLKMQDKNDHTYCQGLPEVINLLNTCVKGMSSFYKPSRKTQLFKSLKIKLSQLHHFSTVEEFNYYLKLIVTNALIIRNSSFTKVSDKTKSGVACLEFIKKNKIIKNVIVEDIREQNDTTDSKSFKLEYKDLLNYIGQKDFTNLYKEEFKRVFYFGIDIYGFPKK